MAGSKSSKAKNIIKISIPQIILFIAIIYFIFVEKVFTVIIEAFSVVVVSLIIIYILNPLVKRVKRKTKFKNTTSVLIAIIIAIVGVGLVFVSIVPALIDSISIMAKTLPQAMHEFTEKLGQIEGNYTILGTNLGLDQVIEQILGVLNTYSDVLFSMIGNGLKSVTIYTTGIFSSIFNLIFILMMTWYGLLEVDSMVKQTKRFMYVVLKKEHADYAMKVMKKTDKIFKNYFVSKAFICLILSSLILVTFAIVNSISSLYISYILLFSVFLGITNFIPYIGPVIGTIPCVIITLIMNGLPSAIALTIIVVVIQQLESMILTPKIMKSSLGVNEFGIVASAAVGGALFGLTGMIISIPVVATLQELVLEFIDKKEKIVHKTE